MIKKVIDTTVGAVGVSLVAANKPKKQTTCTEAVEQGLEQKNLNQVFSMLPELRKTLNDLEQK